MPQFEVELSDGTVVDVEADRQPTPDEVIGALKGTTPAAPAGEPTALGAFGRAAATGIAPSAAAAAAFGPGFALGAPYAPATYGIAPFATGAAASLTAAFGGEALQSWLLKKLAPDFVRQQQLDAERQALAAGAGRIAAMAPSFVVAPGQTVKGLAALPKIIRGAATEAERAAAVGTAAQLGAQAGLTTGQALISEGKLPTGPQLAEALTAAAIYGHPRAWVGGVPGLATAAQRKEAYAAQERLKQEGRIPEHPGVAQVGLPTEAGRGYSPESAARLEEKAQVLLTPAQEQASRLGLGRDFDWVDNFGPSDPQHLKVMQASRAQVDAEGNFVAPGRIRISRAGMDAFMRDTAPELQQNAINSYFAEEGIHAFTTPAESAAYAGTLTALERSIGERNYMRGSAERLTPQNLGDELLRQRMQRLMRMSTSETADAAGRERWSAQSLEFIANLIRKIRELIGTRAAKAGQEITTAMLDRISQNVEAAKRAVRAPGPTEGPPIVKTMAPGSVDPAHIVPAIRLVGGEVRPGLKGDTHPDIIAREDLSAEDIDQRGFSDPEGKTFFLDRDAAAQGTQLPTAQEPGRLHSTDLITAAEQPPGPTGEVSPFARRRPREVDEMIEQGKKLLADPKLANQIRYSEREFPVPERLKSRLDAAKKKIRSGIIYGIKEGMIEKPSQAAAEDLAVDLPPELIRKVWEEPEAPFALRRTKITDEELLKSDPARGIVINGLAKEQSNWLAEHSGEIVKEFIDDEGTTISIRVKPRGLWVTASKAVRRGSAEQLVGVAYTHHTAERNVLNGNFNVSPNLAVKATRELEQFYKDFPESTVQAFPAARRRQQESMDLARRIPKMSLPEFQAEAASFNRINLQLGLNATAEEVSELKVLRDQSLARYKKAMDEYESNRTDANRDELIAAMQIPQFFNEAIRKAEPVPDMPPLQTGMTRLYHGEGAAEGAGLGTSWFTKDWARAASYGDRVSFVDVPQDVADRAQASARAAGSGTASDHVLPLDWSAQAQQMPERLQPKVYDVEEPAARRRARPAGPELPMAVGAGRLTRPEMAPAAEALAAREAAMYERVTPGAIERTAHNYFETEPAPSLEDFSKKVSQRFGPMKPGQLRSAFEDGFWRWAEMASGAEVGSMARDLGLAKKLRLETPEGTLRGIADPPGGPTRQLPLGIGPAAAPQVPGVTRPHFTMTRPLPAPFQGPTQVVGPYDVPFRPRTPAGTRLLETPAQRLRASALATIANKLIVEGEGSRAFLKRTEIDPTEDLASPTIQTKEPIYNEFRDPDQTDPNLPDKLVQDARAFGGEKTTRVVGGQKVTVRKKGYPVSASKRLTTIQNIDTEKVSVVSTYRDGRRGPVVVDPMAPGIEHTKVADILRRYRVIASTLLDEPVQDFRKDYKSLSEYEADWGAPARMATQRIAGYEPPEAAEEAVPRRTIPPEAVTPDESRRIMEQVLEEVPDPKSADDIKAAWEGLLVEPTRPTVLTAAGYVPRPVTAEIPSPENRIVISGLRKVGREIMRKEPNLTADQFLDKLATQIYEAHTQAKDFEDFQRRVMEASRPPVSEAARLAAEREAAAAAQRLEAATAARPAPLVTGARELTVPRFARRAPEELPKGEVPPPPPTVPVEPAMLSPEERAYVESEALRKHPPLKRQKVFTVEWEKFKEGDNPAVLRRLTGRAMDQSRRIRAALAASYKRRDVMREMPATRDAADNIANDLAVNKEINIRNATSSPKLRHGDPEVLAGANPVIAAKAIVPVYNWTAPLRAELKKLMDGHPGINKAKHLMRDPNTRDQGRAMFARIRQESIQTMIEAGTLDAEAPSYAFDDSRLPELDGFDRLVEKGRNKATALTQTGGWFDRLKGRAWLKGADDLTKEIAFARANWGDPRLVETAIRMRRILDQRYDRERDMGHKLKYDPSYMPGRYDGEFFNDDSVLFGPTHRLLGRLYKKNKVFRNYYEAIAEDAYIAMTRDGAAIVGHRVRQGERAIQLKAWGDSLKGLTDEATGEPVALAPKKTPDGKFAPPSPDYDLITLQKGRDPIAVRHSYVHLINQLTDKSAVHDWPMTRFALEWAQRLKHTILLGDFFHLSRLSYYGASIMGSKVGFRKGLTAIEYGNAADLAEAVRNGIIRQSEADWALGQVPVRIGTRTYYMSRIDLMREFEKAGLNIGRIQDAIYADVVRNIPLFGRYNKWLFGRYTRGLMAQAAIVEFERIHAANPKIPVDRLVKDISRDLNQFFGSIGRQGWVRSATMQDISRMLFLAPQWVEGLVDKEVVSAARIAGVPLHAMGLYRNNLAPLGTMGRGIGQGLITMLALTQVINLIGTYLSTGKPRPTWQNERGHEWDAWIPQVGAKGEGFYFSPLAVFNELSHDLVRLIEQKPKAWDAVKQIGQNKLSPYGRLALVLATSQTPTGQYITTTPGVAAAAAQQLAPVPISFGKFMQAGAHLAAPGLVPPVKPEQIQRQLTASLGLKIEPVSQPALEMSRLATEFMKREYGKVETIHIMPTTEPAYSGLRNALRNQDWRTAEKILKTLEKTHSDNDIVKAMKLSARHPFTGAKKYEGEFIDSLNPQQRALYDRAVEQKEMEYQAFLDWFSRQPAP